ncbi:MAG: hypothetical protein ACKOWF_00765 [Chloroflexota bacterium]
MDHDRFDGLARWLGTRVSRRGSLASVAGAAVGITGRRSVTAGPAAEGPCPGGPKANRCTKHKECCTGYCHPKKQRCRCIRQGSRCKAGQTCCGALSCFDGSCTVVNTVQVSLPCNPATDQCANGASCIPFPPDARTLGAPAGTYCLMPDGAPCPRASGSPVSPECSGGYCALTSDVSGVCGTLKIVPGCSAQTDSCAGTTLNLVIGGVLAVCQTSIGGAPVAVAAAAFPGPDCSADTDCVATEVCINVPASGSQCAYGYSPPVTPGGHCVTGAFVCAVSGDCPAKATLTAACTGSLCVYS